MTVTNYQKTNPLMIVNPNSGGYSEKRISDIVRELSLLDLSPSIIYAKTPIEVKNAICSENLCFKNSLIIVAAGDGTFNAVLNNIKPGVVTVAILPLGTSNVMAAELGITSINDGIERIARHNVRSLSVGLLQLESEHYYFALMAGSGLDGAIVRDVRSNEKHFLKQGAFALSAMRNLFPWNKEMIEVLINGKYVLCHSVIVCNASRYCGNFILAPECNLFSDKFVVVSVKSHKLFSYMRLAYDLLCGRGKQRNDVIQITSKNVKIFGTKPIQIDGDFIGYAPANICMVSDFAKIII